MGRAVRLAVHFRLVGGCGRFGGEVVLKKRSPRHISEIKAPQGDAERFGLDLWMLAPSRMKEQEAEAYNRQTIPGDRARQTVKCQRSAVDGFVAIDPESIAAACSACTFRT